MSTTPVTNMTHHRIEGPEALFAWAWQFFKAQWKKLYPIAVIPLAFLFVGSSILALGPGAAVISWIFIVIAIVVGIAMFPALIKAIDDLAGNPSSTQPLSRRYAVGFGLFGTMLWLIVLKIFVSAGSFVLLVVPGLIIGVYTVVYTFSAIIGDKKGFASLVDSFNLVRGRWWAVVARLFFLWIVIELFYLAVYLLMMFLTFVFMSLHAPAVVAILFLIIAIVVAPLLVTFALLYMYRLYVCLRQHPLPASTAPIKGWLIAFFVIGIPGLIGLITLFISLAIWFPMQQGYRMRTIDPAMYQNNMKDVPPWVQALQQQK